MNPKKIEDLNPATTLQDDDLLFASVRQGGAIYASKKVTLKDIADYVRNGTVVVPGGSESGFGGYEMIDTTDSNNYLWSYEVGSANGNNNTRLEKQVSKDCLVWLAYYSSTAINVKIDGVPLKMEFFGGFRGYGWTYSSGYRFYIKSGQTLTVEHNDSNHNIQVFIIPLKSGGKFFFDTSKQDKFIYGELDVDIVNGQPVVQNTSSNTNIFPRQDYVDNPNNNRPKITVDCPTLFSYRYASNTINPDKLNGKSVVSDDIDRGLASGNSADQDPKPFICLDAGDTFEPAIEPEASSVVEWIAYPLLVNESENDVGLEVELKDNHDSNVIDLEVTQSPENSTITYFVSSSYETSDASWQSLVDNKATITFSSQTDKDKKYVFFKVSQNGSDSIYMMQLMQNYYATQSEDTAYDINIVKLAYAGNGNVGFSGREDAENTFLTQIVPGLRNTDVTIYNIQTKEWEAPTNINNSNVSQFVYNRRTNGQYYYWVYQVRKPQTSSGAYTYLHSIILQLSKLGN